MVLVEAGIQQPVAVGVTWQEVHGAVAGSVSPQDRIPLKTRRSIRSRGARAAAAGSEGPRGLRRACVVSACVVSARGPVGALAHNQLAKDVRPWEVGGGGMPSSSVRGGAGQIRGGAAEGGRC